MSLVLGGGNARAVEHAYESFARPARLEARFTRSRIRRKPLVGHHGIGLRLRDVTIERATERGKGTNSSTRTARLRVSSPHPYPTRARGVGTKHGNDVLIPNSLCPQSSDSAHHDNPRRGSASHPCAMKIFNPWRCEGVYPYPFVLLPSPSPASPPSYPRARAGRSRDALLEIPPTLVELLYPHARTHPALHFLLSLSFNPFFFIKYRTLTCPAYAASGSLPKPVRDHTHLARIRAPHDAPRITLGVSCRATGWTTDYIPCRGVYVFLPSFFLPSFRFDVLAALYPIGVVFMLVVRAAVSDRSGVAPVLGTRTRTRASVPCDG
ncbi:hypothetical protein C8R45DRAFT_1100703 [Mycena sanguinolenta]|nr:hypothetical protein C8R45DRAFT_1100703 [Mycena sanguinolenta]